MCAIIAMHASISDFVKLFLLKRYIIILFQLLGFIYFCDVKNICIVWHIYFNMFSMQRQKVVWNADVRQWYPHYSLTSCAMSSHFVGQLFCVSLCDLFEMSFLHQYQKSINQRLLHVWAIYGLRIHLLQGGPASSHIHLLYSINLAATIKGEGHQYTAINNHPLGPQQRL